MIPFFTRGCVFALPLLFASATPAAFAATCTPQTSIPIEEIQAKIIIIGETHGTREMPAFTGGLLCSFVNAGRPVILGLEMIEANQAPLNTYVQSEGTQADRAKLFAIHQWCCQRKDGVSSQAVFELIELVRLLRKEGHKVLINAFSGGVPSPLLEEHGQYWLGNFESGMAANIEGRAAIYPDYTQINLVGAGHARRTATSAFKMLGLPMAYRLEKLLPIHTIGFLHGGGEAWNCTGKTAATSTCGKHPLAPTLSATQSDYHTLVFLPKLSASPPATTGQ